jgi:hypothetical protein
MALQAKTIPIPKPLKKYDSARGIKQTFVSWTNVRVARFSSTARCDPGGDSSFTHGLGSRPRRGREFLRRFAAVHTA